jgi:uncharacterized protein YrrD
MHATQFPRHPTLATALFFAALLPHPAAAESAPPARVTDDPVLTAAHPLGQSARRIIGEDVRSTTGQALGEVRDLVVSADGRVLYALISSGGILGVGDIIRAVPFSAFTSTTTGPGKALAVDLGGADWNKAPIVRLDQLDALNSDAQVRSINQYFGRPVPVVRAGDRHEAASLRLVSQLNGQPVMHDGQTLGEISDIYLHQDRALAVIDPTDRELAARGRIVVGLDRLKWLAPNATAAETTLTSADLANAAPLPVEGIAVADQPYRWVATETSGRRLAPITDGSTAPVSVVARTPVADVRNALHADPALAPTLRRVELQANGRELRLTGTVPSEQLRQQLATAAARVARGWTVKNDLTVQSAAE